jgi:hypothetical protein
MTIVRRNRAKQIFSLKTRLIKAAIASRNATRAARTEAAARAIGASPTI